MLQKGVITGTQLICSHRLPQGLAGCVVNGGIGPPCQVFKDYFNMTVEIILKEATVEIILKEA